MGAEDKTFHQWLKGYGNDLFHSLALTQNSNNPKRWRRLRENVYVWHQGRDGEQKYDFSDSFPFGDRDEVGEVEGYAFALYEHRGGTGEFVPLGEE